jgi:hypothetical protein
LGIKQKSLFDHLMEDTASLASIAKAADPAKLNRDSERIPRSLLRG